MDIETRLTIQHAERKAEAEEISRQFKAKLNAQWRDNRNAFDQLVKATITELANRDYPGAFMLSYYSLEACLVTEGRWWRKRTVKRYRSVKREVAAWVISPHRYEAELIHLYFIDRYGTFYEKHIDDGAASEVSVGDFDIAIFSPWLRALVEK